jgi:hypothetical protein
MPSQPTALEPPERDPAPGGDPSAHLGRAEQVEAQSGRAIGALSSGDFRQRIAELRDEVFELVDELRHDDGSPERQRASDQMQSIANQLGTLEAAISAGNRRAAA